MENTSLFWTQITDKVHVLWEQPSSSGKSVLSNNRHPSERRSHLYGNRTNSSLLIEWKKTLYSVSWLVTISFVVWPELNLWNLSSVNINPAAGEVLCSHHAGGFPPVLTYSKYIPLQAPSFLNIRLGGISLLNHLQTESSVYFVVEYWRVLTQEAVCFFLSPNT